MDSFLIDYLKSGLAWVLVGAGPSIARGYPSWEKQASFAIEIVKIERPGQSLTEIDAAMKRQDYPMAFEHVKTILGGARLVQLLQDKLTPSTPNKIYKLIAKWPEILMCYQCKCKNIGMP